MKNSPPPLLPRLSPIYSAHSFVSAKVQAVETAQHFRSLVQRLSIVVFKTMMQRV